MSNRSRKARMELMLIGLVALVFSILELYIDTFERIVIWAAENESLLITEILTLTIVMTVGLSIYSWRRWREAIILEDDKVQLQRTVSKEKDNNRLMRFYAEAVTQGQEAERRRLARELHDDTIQRMIMLNQQVSLVAYDHSDTVAAHDIQKMSVLIDETIDTLRDLIRALRPTYLDELGLVAALNTLIKETRKNSDFLVEFDALGNVGRLNEAIELAIYRIVQTALANIRQHAEATSATVMLDFQPNCLLLVIQDDGKGFDISDRTTFISNGRFGIIGMQERAELIGGTFEIKSEKRSGTTVSVEVPISSYPEKVATLIG